MYTATAAVGQAMKVHARISTAPHNRLAAQVLWQVRGSDRGHRSPLSSLGNDHWAAQFTPAKTGPHEFIIEAWLDRWQSYHHELQQKFYANIPVGLEVGEGLILLEEVHRER